MLKRAIIQNIVLLLHLLLLLATTGVAQPAIDIIHFGNTTSETGHLLSAVLSDTYTGQFGESARRFLPKTVPEYYGGDATFTMSVDPVKQNYVTVKLSGDEFRTSMDNGRIILECEGKGVGLRWGNDEEIFIEQSSAPLSKGSFVYRTAPLPLWLTIGKSSVRLKLRSMGRWFPYGNVHIYSSFQRNLLFPTRGVYKMYVHTNPFLILPAADSVGAVPNYSASATRVSPLASTAINNIKTRCNSRINSLLSGTNYIKPYSNNNYNDIEYLAQSYFTSWSTGYNNPAVINKVRAAIDSNCANFIRDSTLVVAWGGAYGRLGYAVSLLYTQLSGSLPTIVNLGDGNKTRAAYWSIMFKASYDYGRFNRRTITNQDLEGVTSIYAANMGLKKTDPTLAVHDSIPLKMMYEACGLLDWNGSDLPNGTKDYLFGKGFRMMTSKGTSHEAGWVSPDCYGDLGPKLFEMFKMSGDSVFLLQALKMEKMQSYFHYPSIDSNSNRAMLAEGVICWRNEYFPGEVHYGQDVWVAGETGNATALGFLKQMISDGQFFYELNQLTDVKESRYLMLPDSYDKYLAAVTATPPTALLPVTPGAPDFAVADEENGVVAIKRGNENLYWMLYRRAYAINNLAKVHHITPLTQRAVELYEDQVEFIPSGSFVVRNDYVGGDDPPPADTSVSAYVGIQQPIPLLADGTTAVPNRRIANFYGCRYGNYLVGLNTTTDRTFQLTVPPGYGMVPDLVSGSSFSLASPVMVGPKSTVVFYLDDAYKLLVTLATFTVTKQPGNTALLNWTTTNEFNSQYFSIERSVDGVTFAPIGTVASTADAAGFGTYTFTDASPIIGVNYYRIVMVDLVNVSYILGVRMVNFKTSRIFTSIASGNWGNSSTWDQGTAVPSSSADTVVISYGHTVTITSSVSCAKFIANGTALNGTSYTLTVGDSMRVGSMSFSNGANIQVNGRALIAAGAVFILGGQFTSNSNVTINGQLRGVTIAGGSVQTWLLQGTSPTVTVNGILGGSGIATAGEGLRIFLNHTGTATFTGGGVVNIARLATFSGNVANQSTVLNINMNINNRVANAVVLSLQQGNNGVATKVLTINAGKIVKLTQPNGCFHHYTSAVPGFVASGGTMTYNVNGTLDVSAGQFNLFTNTLTAANLVTVNVGAAGTLWLPENVRMHTSLAGQSAAIVLGANATIGFGGSNAASVFTGTVSGTQPVFPTTIPNLIIDNAASVTLPATTNVTGTASFLNGALILGGNNFRVNNALWGAGTITGHTASSVTVDGNAGMMKFTGGKAVLKNFQLNSNATVTLADSLDIVAGPAAGSVALAPNAILVTNDHLTLKSDSAGTARVAPLPVNPSGTALATINGKVIIERYLPMSTSYNSRRWRLLTAPINGTGNPTVWSNWQEGATPTASPTVINSSNNPVPGYGTHITRGVGSINNVNGFDAGTTANSSIYYMAGGNWVAPAKTNGTTATTGLISPITGQQGYMIFVRGDRSQIISNQYAGTTGGNWLRAKGNVITGNVTVPVTGGRQVIANPYASAISFNNISFKGISPGIKAGTAFYLWDPKLVGTKNVGGFVTFSSNGNNTYTYVPFTGTNTGMSAYGNTGIIESGEAFMIDTTAGGNIVFHESDKIAASSSVGIASRPGDSNELPFAKMHINLWCKDASGNDLLADGIAGLFHVTFSNLVNEEDVIKMRSFTSKEKISIQKAEQVLAIERRNVPLESDTIHLDVNVEANKQYSFQFVLDKMEDLLQPYVEDHFLQTITPVSSSTPYSFSTTSDSMSFAPNRFNILFKQKKDTQDVVATMSAHVQSSAVLIEWSARNEYGINHFEIERSADGTQFTSIGSTRANGSGSNTYQFTDANPLPNTNYYRIRIVFNSGQFQYSNRVSVAFNSIVNQFVVLDNPVRDKEILLRLINVDAGIYQISIFNTAGQLVAHSQLKHTGGSAIEHFKLPACATGIYMLSIKNEKVIVTKKIIVN